MKRITVYITVAAIFVALMLVAAVPSFAACTNNGCKTTTSNVSFSPSGNPNAKANFTSTVTATQQNSFNSPSPNKRTQTGSCTHPAGQC